MDSMEIDDDRHRSTEGLIPPGVMRRNQTSRCVTVCLGLLFAVLLAGNIGQFVFYEVMGRAASADPTQSGRLQGGEASAAERNQLEARLSNVTDEKNRLQESYDAATTQNDAFKASLDDLRKERDHFKSSYSTLKRSSDGLLSHCNETQRNLRREREKLQADYSSLQLDRERLQTANNQLQVNQDEIQRDYDLLVEEKRQLQGEKDQLGISNEALQEENQQLKTNISTLSAEKDELEKRVANMPRLPCERGWETFGDSCYFFSTEKKNWTSSREDCKARGGDLVIIGSSEEQDFINGRLKQNVNAWIGLTDSLKEGTWTWVDGTPITIAFWQKNQPNNFDGDQDCGETINKQNNGGWNDDGCFANNVWICEK